MPSIVHNYAEIAKLMKGELKPKAKEPEVRVELPEMTWRIITPDDAFDPPQALLLCANCLGNGRFRTPTPGVYAMCLKCNGTGHEP